MNRFLTLNAIVLICFASSCNNNKELEQETDSRIIFTTSDSTQRAFVGSSLAQQQLEQFLDDSSANPVAHKILITDKQTLIAIAEPLLFKIYGKEKIMQERPYEIYLFGDYWIMNGTLPRNTFGGTFTIAIHRRTCHVIGISHGK